MKRMLAGVALAIATAALSGCYYDPGYSYVRPVAAYGGGDAYYGTSSYSYAPGYYYPSYGYYGYGGYGCCYGPAVSVGIGGVWYSGHGGYYGHGYHGGGYYHGGYYGHGGYTSGHGSYRGGTRGTWSGHGNSGH